MTHNTHKAPPPQAYAPYGWRRECRTCNQWDAGDHGLECSVWHDPGAVGPVDLDDEGRCKAHSDNAPIHRIEGIGGLSLILGRPVAVSGVRIISSRDKRYFD